MAVLAHISDLHFGRENRRIVDALIAQFAVLNPELIVISGDITQRARTREYRAAQDFLKELSHPYHVIPGNHDISATNLAERFFFPWSKWYDHIGEQLEPIYSGDGYLVVGVNTCSRFGAFFDWSRGHITMLQSKQVRRRFSKDLKKRLRIVAAHHPFWLPKQYERRHLVGGRDAAMLDFVEAEVDLILCGHVHCTYTHVLSGIIISHAGTAVSTRLLPDTPNSFKMIRGDANELCIETRIWDGKRFQDGFSDCFSKRGKGWIRDVFQTADYDDD